jgi:hypothetical protein
MTAKTYSGKNNAETKATARAYGWRDSIHPTLRKCAKDGAPEDEWLVVENKQRQLQYKSRKLARESWLEKGG